MVNAEHGKMSCSLSCPETVSTARFIPTESGFSWPGCVTGSCAGNGRDGKSVLTAWNIGPSETNPGTFDSVKKGVGYHPSGITDIQFLKPDVFVTGDSQGAVRCWALGNDGDVNFKCLAEWDEKHTFKNGSGAKVTALSVDMTSGDGVFASVGEDGRLLYFRLSSSNSSSSSDSNSDPPLAVRRAAFGTPLTCVTHAASRELVAGSAAGSLFMWDLRCEAVEGQPTGLLLSDSDKLMSTTSVDANPSVRHVIAAGMEDGTLVFWDLRNLPKPVVSLKVHRGPVTGLMFHPLRPTEIVTSSFDGRLMHIFGLEHSSEFPGLQLRRGDMDGGGTQCVWLNEDAGPLEHRVRRVDVAPPHSGRSSGFLSVDIRRDTVVAAREDCRALVTQLDRLIA